MFKAYYWIALLISLAAVVLYVTAALGPISPSYDGQGPSVDAIAVYLLNKASIIALAHSWIVSFLFRLRPRPSIGRTAARILRPWAKPSNVATAQSPDFSWTPVPQ
jgi:hypothetical protein